ncbi:MAG: DUF2807 domain-containing protein [Vicinamibacterales bacterium]|nr:DUF2807 domain-containing protein [Vicinamibacterales bacterium]
MSNVYAWLAVGLASLVAGCGFGALPGSGQMKTDRRAVSDFTTVELRGTGKLVIEQNGTEALTIEADDNLLPYLTSEVRGGRLVLGTEDGTTIRPSREIVYTLSVKNLNGVTLSGTGTVAASGISSDSLTMTLNGSGSISANGRADRQEINLSGSGDYQGAELKGKTVAVNIAGSGSGVVAASERLDIFVAGSGSIEYIGDPQVTKKIAGSGSVKKR